MKREIMELTRKYMSQGCSIVEARKRALAIVSNNSITQNDLNKAPKRDILTGRN